ncbi:MULTISPECIES: bis(5'-nucleosyl)-tetraphosphatase (symmetrical) YqeK [Exiguobacterium]|uniref:bis(5'-nucleosyl)-tetraphosphatase (symmetrical) n=1 Tax=Exiguobacterium antarcticum TaxID=132920 RepID=A0ABT6QZ96_9BACL|nr:MULTISPECIES: bis(5'-nucleosyl)-tetraphosphatase (symmetrical) YqeK [Exiguobacterium]AFS69885.1 Metal dependent phosphohydrolase [Exiguobacterium antarcticum B7]MCT4779024.1 bis(5'-nucleosyl)-tetraphosphatase (symmetrical) YqeK [Exiguobacterium soli]MDI3234008.1 bis(5'-nucleosyl)-tetraphosphatase (symmetrical) YqeK [Exiguobacterium antarcticum]
MRLEEAKQIIEQTLPEKRYIHTLGVVETAIQLAQQNGVSKEQAALAAMLHDYAKYRNVSYMRTIAVELGLDDLLMYDDELLHAPIGAELVKRELGIEDASIYQAIANHTTGAPNMPLLDQVIFVADAIEPNRNYPGVEQLRQIAQKDLTQAVIATLVQTIEFLCKKQTVIFPLTIETYNAFVAEKRKGTVL